MINHTEDSINFCKKILHEYTHNRNAENAENIIEFLTDDIFFVGTGSGEVASGKEQAIERLKREFQKFSGDMELDFHTSTERVLDENTSLVYMEIGLSLATDSSVKIETRMSISVRRTADGLKISSIHCSVANVEQKNGEVFPSKFMDNKSGDGRQKNKHLEQNEEAISLAMESADVNIWELDLTSNTLYQSPSAQKIHNLFADKIEDFPKPVFDAGHCDEDTYNEILKVMAKLKNGAKVATGDFWLYAENRGRWCERTTYITIFDDNNVPVRAIGIGRDVTEEAKTKAQKQVIELALNNADVSIWEYDILNNKFSLFGNSKRELISNLDGESPESFAKNHLVGEENQNAFLELHDQIRSGHQNVEGDCSFVDEFGNVKWLRINYIGLNDEKGGFIKEIGCAVDVTKSMKMQNQYNQELLYLNGIEADNLLVKGRANITKDIVEICVGNDKAMVTKGGISAQEMTEKISASAVTATGRRLIRNLLNRDRILKAFANDVDETMSAVYRRFMKDGTVLWVKTAIKIFQKPDSKDIMCFIYTYDVDKETTMSKIIDKIVDEEYEIIAVLDSKSGKIMQCSSSGGNVELVPKEGAYYEESICNLIDKIVIGDDKKVYKEAIRFKKVISELEKKPTYSVFFPVTENGKVGYKTWTLSYLDKEKTKIFYARKNETELFLAQQEQQKNLSDALVAAQQANAAKSDFLSRMSHEIRTPMNAIIGMSAIASQCIDDPEQVANCISKIGISSRFLLSLINDILDMSRIESGKMLLSIEEIPFDDFIDGINSIFFAQANEKNIDYECVIDSGLEDYYLGDSTKLQQVLINVLANAVKFTDEGGRITLSIAQSSKSKNDVNLRFTVVDTGCGISEEFISKLFDPFTQEHMGTTSSYGGTGLGLAICKNLVSMMNGSINVRSIVGVGTEFTIDVRLGITEESRRHSKSKLKLNFQALDTLVVDDDISICENEVMILKDMGIKASWVDSGRKAVEEVQARWNVKKNFDIIILDWKMPDMDGIETTRQIRKIVGNDVTIIVMTAYDFGALEMEAKQAGVNLFMRKPMFKSNLISAFEKTFGDKHDKDGSGQMGNYNFTGKRLLLAEDHPINKEIAVKLLTKKGFIVDHAENGLRALEMFTNSEVGFYDAILMDIRMPQMDGLQATFNIRNWGRADAKKIPIIAMTANAFEEDIEKSHRVGMNAHLAKPIEPKVLYETLHKFICKEEIEE